MSEAKLWGVVRAGSIYQYPEQVYSRPLTAISLAAGEECVEVEIVPAGWRERIVARLEEFQDRGNGCCARGTMGDEDCTCSVCALLSDLRSGVVQGKGEG